MIIINFYPWREEKNQNQKKFLQKTIMIFMFLLIVTGLSIHFILLQRQQNMEKELNEMNEELKSMKIANTDENNFSSLSMAKSLEEFSVPKKKMVCFTHVSRLNRTILFAGKARSANDFTQFILQWNNQKKFSEIQIKSMEEDKNGRINFQFEATHVV